MKIKVSDDKEHVKLVREKIKENGGHCLCAIVKNDDTKCICKAFFEQESGECHCGLYVKCE